MKKIFIILLTILSIQLYANNLISSSEKKFEKLLTENEKNYLKSINSLKVQVQKDWIPYNYLENDIAKGYSNDYIRLLSKVLGIKIEFIKGFSWDEYMNMLKKGEIDLITNMVITKEREKSFIFTDNFTFATYKSLFSNNNKYSKLEQLKNKNLGLVKGNYEEELIKNNYYKIKIKTYKTNIKLIEGLLNNEVDAIIGNKTVINYLLDEKFITTISSTNIINDVFPLKNIKFAFRKENIVLKSIIDKAMSVIDKKEIENLKNRWKLNLKTHNVLNNQEKTLLEKNPFIVYYNLNGWYPFIFSENNIPKGISIDFLNEITKNLDLKITYKGSNNFNQSLASLKNNPNIILLSTSATKEREEYASFTKPYASFPIAIVTNIKENFLIDLKDLEGKTVAVGENYSAHKLLLKYHPKIKFVPVKNTQIALDLVAKGQVYAAADILPVINYELVKYGFTNLKISGTSKFNFDIQIMLNKQNKHLIPIFNKLIENIDESEKEKIITKWIRNNKIEKTDYTIVYWVVLLSLLIVSFTLYRQYNLKKQKIKIEKEIKIATQELKELNQMHEETQELAKIATIKKNIKTAKYWVSKQFYKIFEFELNSDITEEKILSVIDEKDQKRLIDLFKKNAKYKNNFVNFDNIIIKITTKSGKTKYLDLFLSYEFDKNYEVYERKAILQDITEKVLAKEEEEKKEKALIQQSKLASMGEMIGAIAHQWRQPLNELSIRIQKLKYNYAKDQIDEEFIKEFIQKNKKTIDFMSKTIDDFRNFFRIDKEKKIFHIKDAINEVLSIQSAQLKNHHIQLELTGNNFSYEGFKTEFQQVIINLISNSKDALVKNNINDPKIKIVLKDHIIKVIDNGGGISDNIIDRIFEPYFTTKEQGEGTGMGLYMSKMIIEDNMNGNIYISNVDNGAVITIILKNNYI